MSSAACEGFCRCRRQSLSASSSRNALRLTAGCPETLAHLSVWRPFVDPYPPEKRQRKDVLEHAKIFLFGHGDSRKPVFSVPQTLLPRLGFHKHGSRGCSAVGIQRRDREAFWGLAASLKANSVEKELGEKVWPPATDERPESKFKCLLSAVAAMESGYRLSMASGVPPKNSLLALSDRCTVAAECHDSNPSRGRFLRRTLRKERRRVSGIAWIVSESGEPCLILSVSLGRPSEANERPVALQVPRLAMTWARCRTGPSWGRYCSSFWTSFATSR